MGEIHDFLAIKGKRAALDAGLDRRAVEAAADYLSDEDTALSFAFSGWAQVALPHKCQPDDKAWTLVTERASLVIQPGLRVQNGTAVPVGVPYGSRARMIMLYLQTQAVRTGSRQVELGRSLREWLARMGISAGGKSVMQVRDQAERISRCRLSLEVTHAGKTLLHNQLILDRSMFVDFADKAQGKLFVEEAVLSETFFDALRKHPVPLRESAIKAISNNSMALDIYLWLAYRLHRVDGTRLITWKALLAQFGAGFNRLRNFRVSFVENLQLALAVYPEASVQVSEAGLILEQSRPPVEPKAHQVLLPRP